MEVSVRGYSEGDIPSMTAIWNSIVDGGMAFPQEDPLTEAEAREFFGSQSHCGVAVYDGRVVGIYILHPNNVGRCGHICNASYAVEKGMTNKGIGSALVEDSLETAAGLGFRIMQFNAVVQENASAIHLYEKEGFHRLGMIPGGFRGKDGEYRTILLFYHEL